MPPKQTQKTNPTPRPNKTLLDLFPYLTLPPALLALAAVTSPISQLTLAPTYGAIPSAVNHNTAIACTFLLGLLPSILSRRTRTKKILPWISIWAAYIPSIQLFLQPYSGRLGPVLGPVLSGFLSCHTILIPNAYAVSSAMREAYMEYFDVSDTKNPMFSALAVVWFLVLEQRAAGWLGIVFSIVHHSDWNFTLTPVHLQSLVAVAYSLLAPSWLMVFALPAFLFTALFNPHVSYHSSLNTALLAQNWTLLDRAWSNTGYISVLQDNNNLYRVLRCDHSLLGGEWLLTPDRASQEGWQVNEPIYSAFEMLEAVRLLEPAPHETPVPDTSAHALVIGLGIGTAPKALLQHGIDTTIVELDPVVHSFATKYFHLPTNHTAVLQDASRWVEKQASPSTTSEDGTTTKNQKYDYIIHDVFTGGAEPLALFNTEFLSNLRMLLKPQGAIALNYAGDLSLPLTQLVLSTIQQAFTIDGGQCRIFRDAPPEKHAGSKVAQHQDFLNMVVFCRPGKGQVKFREPRSEDFLGSLSRKHYLLPKPEMEIPFPQLQQGLNVLKAGEEDSWAGAQAMSAQRHWYIMRKVLPDVVWELW